jgi:hypothetical protein
MSLPLLLLRSLQLFRLPGLLLRFRGPPSRGEAPGWRGSPRGARITGEAGPLLARVAEIAAAVVVRMVRVGVGRRRRRNEARDVERTLGIDVLA